MDAVLGVMAATVISLLNVAALTIWAMVGAANVQSAVTAAHMRVWDAGALQYVKDFASTIAATATATTPVTVTTAMMAAAGNYLPLGYSGVNPFGQTLELQVLQPTAGQLQAIVTSQGGRSISDPKQLVQVAAQAQAGFVPYNNQNGDATMNAGNAYGAFGAWGPVALSHYSNPGSGHLAALLAFSGSSTQANNTYLYRVSVPNQPQLNHMQTDLGLTDAGGTAHNITGVNTITATTFQNSGGGQFNSDQGGSLELGGNNSQAGTGQPYIDFHQGGQGVQDFNARIQNDSNNHVEISAANGQATLGVQGALELGNIATPNGACSRNGAIAGDSDGSGLAFNCLYGRWVPIGGHGLRYAYYLVSNGSFVPAPTCPGGGTPEILLTAQNFYVDPTATVNLSPVSGTGPWTVNITDGSGSGIPGDAIAETYCTY